jgi:hypothetical protein
MTGFWALTMGLRNFQPVRVLSVVFQFGDDELGFEPLDGPLDAGESGSCFGPQGFGFPFLPVARLLSPISARRVSLVSVMFSMKFRALAALGNRQLNRRRPERCLLGS